MSETIKYDFVLANTVRKNLESAAETLERGAAAPIRAQIDELKMYWQDEASAKFAYDLELIAEQTEKAKNDIISRTEELCRLTRRMRIAEEEAERIVAEEQR